MAARAIPGPWRIKAKSRKAALNRYFGFLNRSLSCICDGQWYVSGKEQLVSLTQPAALCLTRLNEPPLYLQATQSFHYELHPDFPGEWKVKTDGYAYTLSFNDDFHDELLSFQWHPKSVSRVKTPHVHAALADAPAFHRAHIPTRRIYLEDVILLAIEDLGVQPINDDWQTLLEDAIKRVMEFGSWT